MSYSDFDKRMKKYEFVSRNYLTTRMPVIIRIDGKAFHTFTKHFAKPFDIVLSETMQDTMKYLCENIQGCVLGYTQSDEITLVLVDYKNINTSPWFDYNIQKCASIASSMATMIFNKKFAENVEEYLQTIGLCDYIMPLKEKAEKQMAMFDARVFNIPKEEVCNNIYWRQQDAIRNSIQMVGRKYFSHKELFKKSQEDIKKMLLELKTVDWNNCATKFKRGSCCIRKIDEETGRRKWIIDNEIPTFKGDGCKYVNDLIFINE